MAYEIYKFKEPSGGGSLSFGSPEQIYLTSMIIDDLSWHIVAIDDSVDVSEEDGVDDLELVSEDLVADIREATIINWGERDDIDADLAVVGL
jgi:hypothetical protein